MKEKLAKAQNKGQNQKYEKIDFSKIFWKPVPGKYQIRILPSKLNSKDPFREIKMHYGYAKGPIMALTNWGEKDPIVEFCKELRKSSDKEDWGLASKLEPKTRYFANVVVRGQENEGAKLWEFGKIIYQQLLELADNEDYGDYTDLNEGRDFTATVVKDVVAGKSVNKISLTIKPKVSPISTDASQIESLLNNQTDILAINRRYKFDDLKEVLQNFLNPEPKAEEGSIISGPVTEFDTPPLTAYEKSKKSVTDEFDKMFETSKK